MIPAESMTEIKPARTVDSRKRGFLPATVYTYALYYGVPEARAGTRALQRVRSSISRRKNHGGPPDGSPFLAGTVRHRRRGNSPQPAPRPALRACAAVGPGLGDHRLGGAGRDVGREDRPQSGRQAHYRRPERRRG